MKTIILALREKDFRPANGTYCTEALHPEGKLELFHFSIKNLNLFLREPKLNLFPNKLCKKEKKL